ncbi:MAG: transglycosylase domain-containing protein [Candidatus Promineofilum sp.]|nr:transglycosylase domain-containing protein [Promineifilum sp.]
MRATDIVRRRRERASWANRPGRSLGRIVTAATLVLLSLLILFPLAVAAGGAAGAFLLTRGLPDIHTLEELPSRYRPTLETTQLFARGAPDSSGVRHPVLIDEITDPRAAGAGWVAIDTLPDHVIVAYLAAADPLFFTAETPSVSSVWTEWLRTGAIRDDHSPIIRELIANHLRDGATARPADTRRTIQDWLLARQLEETISRRHMLEWAINSRYYGHLAYGIEAAARVYFDKSATDLSLGEAAMLAALAQKPAANPFDDPAAARLERDAVLVTMTAMSAITPRDEAAAREEPTATAAPPGSQSVAPEFARLARRELEAILGPARLLAGGWRAETTLDMAIQTQAICLVTRAIEDLGPEGAPPCPTADALPAETNGAITEAAVVVLNPATGEIEAMTGQAAFTSYSIGTLVRPFIYLTVLSQGYTAASAMMDVPSVYLQDGQSYSSGNPDGLYLGPLRLRQALAADRAVTAAEALGWVGVGLVRETARALGLRPDGPDDLSFAETGFEASLLDIGRAFATIGNGGAMAGMADDPERPATIARIVDANGREVYARETATKKTLAAELAYLLTDILADHDTRCALIDCSVSPELPDGRSAAVSNGESAAGHAWAVGYTPDRLVGVRVTGDGATGSADAAPLWRALMQQAIAGTEPSGWSRPPSLRPIDVCDLSGLLPSPEVGCPTVREWFIPGTEPTAFDTMTREVAVNRETGRLATIYTPPHLIERRVYTVMPPAAAQWAISAGIESPPIEYDTIGSIPTRSGAAELKLEPWAVVNGQLSVVGSAGGDDFAYYRLAVFPGLTPEKMENLVERSDAPVDAAELAVWDTTLVDDGLYSLLLTVIRNDGTFDEVAVPVIVDNAGALTSP